MNLGIYISRLSDKEQLNCISSLVENTKNDISIHDISIFYDDIDFNENNTQCGMFNSTDLWSFNGNLVVTSLDALATSLRVVNNINIFYYHGWTQEKNTLKLVTSVQNVKIISRSEKDSKEIYRTTGKTPVGISDNFNNIVNLISRCEDEYKSNNNDVYQTA